MRNHQASKFVKGTISLKSTIHPHIATLLDPERKNEPEQLFLDLAGCGCYPGVPAHSKAFHVFSGSLLTEFYNFNEGFFNLEAESGHKNPKTRSEIYSPTSPSRYIFPGASWGYRASEPPLPTLMR